MLTAFRRSLSCAAVLRNAEAAGKSSCAPGTVLNLKIRKAGDEPVALADSEYPEWLWDMLDQTKKDQELQKTDIMKWRRKQLGAANTKKIKSNNFLSQM